VATEPDGKKHLIVLCKGERLMPISVLIGVVSLLFAVVFYSMGVWGAFRRRGFSRLDVVALWVGAVFDIIATASMASTIGGLDLSQKGWLHTTLALAVMVGMMATAAVGTFAFVKHDEKVAAITARLAVAPWVAWIAVFVWGMATRMPRR
jgi:hypothetical protein